MMPLYGMCLQLIMFQVLMLTFWGFYVAAERPTPTPTPTPAYTMAIIGVASHGASRYLSELSSKPPNPNPTNIVTLILRVNLPVG